MTLQMAEVAVPRDLFGAFFRWSTGFDQGKWRGVEPRCAAARANPRDNRVQ